MTPDLATIMQAHYRTYRLGDFVLVNGVTDDGEQAEGRVVHIFQLEGWNTPHYVIEIDTSIDPIYEVRSGHVLQMRPSKGSQEYESWNGTTWLTNLYPLMSPVRYGWCCPRCNLIHSPDDRECNCATKLVNGGQASPLPQSDGEKK